MHRSAHPSFGMRPSFDWYDPDLSEFDFSDYILKKSVSYQKNAHPSFGMTITKTLRSVFS